MKGKHEFTVTVWVEVDPRTTVESTREQIIEALINELDNLIEVEAGRGGPHYNTADVTVQRAEYVRRVTS